MFGNVNNPLIFISSLGIFVNSSNFEGPIGLRYEVKEKFEINKDIDIMASSEITVSRFVEVSILATINLEVKPNLISKSARDLNAFYLEQAADFIGRSEAETPKKSKKKSKRSDDDDEEEIDYTKYQTVNAYDILIDLIRIEDENTLPIQQTPAFRFVSSKSEKNAEALNSNLARLRKAINTRTTALQNLRNGGSDDSDIDQVTNDMLPSLGRDLTSVNENGLKKYEDRLRQEREEAEERIQKIYGFFENNVINRYNETAMGRTGPFVNETLDIAGEVISREKIIEKLITEELVVINQPTGSKKK